MNENKRIEAIDTAYEDWANFDPVEPEKNLLKAILLSAISDLKKSGEPAKEAQEFFLDTDEEYVFSFRAICAHLSVDPEKVLKAIAQAKDDKETKILIAEE